MPPKSRRLSRLEILTLKSSSPPLHTPLGTVYISTGCGKVGIIVSKKTAPSAVKRNHLRRRFYRALFPLVPSRLNLLLYVSRKGAIFDLTTVKNHFSCLLLPGHARPDS